MAEIYTTSYNEETLLKLYKKRKESDDLIGALFALRSLEKLSTNKVSLYEYFAETYFLLNQYEKSSEYWCKYLGELDKNPPKKVVSVSDTDDIVNRLNSILNSSSEGVEYAKAYAGLGSIYFKAGNKKTASYYFNKQLKISTTEIKPYTEVITEFLEDLTSVENNYYLVYPYEKANFTTLLNEATEYYKSGDFKSVMQALSVIPPKSKYYAQKCAITALCKYMTDDIDGAIKDFDTSIKLDGDNVETLCNAISILNRLGKKSKCKTYLEKLENIKNFDADGLYKTTLVYCELSKEDLALKTASDYLKINANDVNVLLILGQVYYNKKDYETAVKYFNKAYELTGSFVTKYYLNLVSKKLKGISTPDVLDYSFDVPDFQRKKIIKCVTKFLNEEGIIAENDIDLVYYISEYAFENQSFEMQSAMVKVLGSLDSERAREYLANLLIKLSVFDQIKTAIIGFLTADGYQGVKPTMLSNRYKSIEFKKFAVSGKGSDIMLEAYALCFSKIAPLEDNVDKLLETAYSMFNSGLDFTEINDVNSLSAVLFELSNLKTIKSRRDFASFFGANLKEVKRLKTLFLEYTNN